MISGVEIICENCLEIGPQLVHGFQTGVDYDGDPMIVCRCPTCNELIEVVFVGGRHRQLVGK